MCVVCIYIFFFSYIASYISVLLIDRHVVSSSLLTSDSYSKSSSSYFCLGLPDFCDCENYHGALKQATDSASSSEGNVPKCLKLSLPKPKEKPRFAAPVSDTSMP